MKTERHGKKSVHGHLSVISFCRRSRTKAGGIALVILCALYLICCGGHDSHSQTIDRQESAPQVIDFGQGYLIQAGNTWLAIDGLPTGAEGGAGTIRVLILSTTSGGIETTTLNAGHQTPLVLGEALDYLDPGEIEVSGISLTDLDGDKKMDILVRLEFNSHLTSDAVESDADPEYNWEKTVAGNMIMAVNPAFHQTLVEIPTLDYRYESWSSGAGDFLKTIDISSEPVPDSLWQLPLTLRYTYASMEINQSRDGQTDTLQDTYDADVTISSQNGPWVMEEHEIDGR